MAGTILYIDDAPELPDGAAQELAVAGYRLVHTSDVGEALQRIRAGEPRVVLLEVLSASCDGLELMRRIRAAAGPARQPPIVIVTRGMRTPQLFGMAIEFGASDFLCKPVLRSELVATVLEHAERERAPGQVDPEDPEADAASSPAFSADLAQEPVPALLERLHRLGATGVLIVRGPEESRGIQLRNGSPVAVVSRRTTESLEDHLLRTKQITEEQHEAVAEQVFARMGSPRDILVAMGALSEEEIDAEIAQRAARPFFEMFGWTSGSSRFEPGRRLKASQALELEQSPTFLLFEGVLRESPDQMVRELLDRVATLYVSTAEGQGRSFEELEETPCDPQLLDRFLGVWTVSELLASGEVEERILYALLAAGLIEVHADPVLMLDAMQRDLSELRPDPPREPPREEAPPAEPPAPGLSASDLGEWLARVSSQDDFEILGVEPETPDEEVRAAYERLLESLELEANPGHSAEAAEQAAKLRQRIDQAYDRLRASDSRQAFAALRPGARKKPPATEAAGSRSLEAESWFRKGAEFLKAKRYEKAVEALGMAAHLDPRQGEYAAHLGYALFRSNPYNELVQREALEHVAKGIKLSPDRERSFVFLGRIFKATGEIESAIKVFRRAVRIKPDCHEALQELRLLNLRESKPRSLLDRLLGR